MNDSRLGKEINNARKLVVTSRQGELKCGQFSSPRPLSSADIESRIRDLKKGDGGDIAIFGSPTLVRSLTRADLIDEYQIQVHPVVVNVGEQLFDGVEARKDFQLAGAHSLKDGSVVVIYRPAKRSG